MQIWLAGDIIERTAHAILALRVGVRGGKGCLPEHNSEAEHIGLLCAPLVGQDLRGGPGKGT